MQPFCPGKLFLIVAACCVLNTAAVAQGIVVPPDQAVAGISQADWSRTWWQWAGSFDATDSPVADRTGRNCSLKQSGPVWFLAGTYGTARTVRTCTLPRDKYIFFPLINYVVMPDGPREICDHCCPSYIEKAREITDQPDYLTLEVDGQRIEGMSKHRQATGECFDMGIRMVPSYRVFPSAANGYYVMLRPLPPGKHVLNFGGVLPGMSQAVTYTLFVE